jgi:hypothetical protein
LRVGIGILVVLAVGLCLLWWQAPELYDSRDVDPGDQAAATATTRAGILAVFAATTAAIGAILALAETRRANLTSDEREREANAADRYTKAIDQLGAVGVTRDDMLDVRLGGIYALQRLALDFPHDYLSTVVEVLCAFVRSHGRGPDGLAAALDEHGDVDDSRETLMTCRPPNDVQAALTVIGRVHNFHLGSRVDLKGAHLECADLQGANLVGAILFDANLTNANLYHANLASVFLHRTVFLLANTEGANFEGAMPRPPDLDH